MPRWQVELAPAPLKIEVTAPDRSGAAREAGELYQTLMELGDISRAGYFIGAVIQTDPVPVPNREARAPVRRHTKPNK
jgi:hypothetical protein